MSRFMAGFYLKVFRTLPIFLQRRIHPLEFAIQELAREAADKCPAGAWALDAGAGESRFREFFGAARYLALDTGRGDWTWDYSSVDLLADLARIPLRDNSVAVILNTQVLEHVAEPDQVIREFHRVLAPGGRLFLSAPQGWCEHQQPHDYFRFTRFSLAKLFREAGFDSYSIEPQGGYFHYLGHRLTYIPKILFQGRRRWVRVLLFPLEFTSLVLFCFLSPLICHFLDRFDDKREFTLGYACRVAKGKARSSKLEVRS